MTITSLRFLYIFWGSGLLCGGSTLPCSKSKQETGDRVSLFLPFPYIGKFRSDILTWFWRVIGKSYKGGKIWNVGFPRDRTSRCPFVPEQKHFLVLLSLCSWTRAEAKISSVPGRPGTKSLSKKKMEKDALKQKKDRSTIQFWNFLAKGHTRGHLYITQGHRGENVLM